MLLDFPTSSRFLPTLPNAGYVGVQGGLLADELGNTVDVDSHSPLYTSFHLYYEAFPSQYCPTGNSERDFHHTLIFAYPRDEDDDLVADEDDNCPSDYNPDQDDCDGNGLGDTCTIAGGVSSDCNNNDLPDLCEIDSDSDGVIDACESCPQDPNKLAPGICGCGTPDDDGDADMIVDCIDGLFVACSSGPTGSTSGSCLSNFDYDNDGDVDLADFADHQTLPH